VCGDTSNHVALGTSALSSYQPNHTLGYQRVQLLATNVKRQFPARYKRMHDIRLQGSQASTRQPGDIQPRRTGDVSPDCDHGACMLLQLSTSSNPEERRTHGHLKVTSKIFTHRPTRHDTAPPSPLPPRVPLNSITLRSARDC
jgi:hypothetical protein